MSWQARDCCHLSLAFVEHPHAYWGYLRGLCSEKCQRGHWPEHKPACKDLQKAKAGGAASSSGD